MKLNLDAESSPQATRPKKKHGRKNSQLKPSKSKVEKQNSAELHLEQEAPTTDEASLQQHLDSASLSDSKEDVSDDFKDLKLSKARESGSADEQDHVNTGSPDNLDQENEDDNPIRDQVDEESDSSEDEVAPRNTVGDVPLEWYRDEKHIGYDISGKKILKKEREDKLQSFLASADDSKSWRKLYDEYNDEVIELSKEEVKQLRRLLKGKAPHADFDPYAPYVDWFKWDDGKHPLSNAPEPKRRFIRSKWEAKKVVQLVRAIRNGHIKFDKPKEEQRFYHLWGDDSSSTEKTAHLSYIPAPKPKFPGHDESYNPSLEYIPTQEEINSYQLMYDEDRPKFIPRRFTSMRSVPAYDSALKDAFERCLDLYLCPRVRKKRINIDPESLKPKLPSRKDLRPYPTTCYLEFRGHKDAVMSISTEANGQWIASGSLDGTVRIWEVETGRCLKVWELGEAVKYVAWNPLPELPILAAAVGVDVLLLNTGFGDGEVQAKVKELLHIDALPATDNSDKTPIATWLQDDKVEGIRLRHFKTVSSVEWHRKGDYLSTVMPAGESRGVVIHQLSRKLTQKIPFKLHGLPVSSIFHPTRSIFFVSTKKNVRVYDLLKQKLMKKLETGLREVSSIAVHPAGDNVIVGSREGKVCWFDMDLSSQPYKILSCHPKDVTNVAFHRSYPLFASCSDDCTAYVFHGMVYSDLTQNPLIRPLEILRGHKTTNGRGVMDCKFHPRQPWLFTAGADSVIKLYCH
ncbi:ribosome biogenesis protein BOP1 homolog isoform X1 [Cucurbita pepo subsp. pepo]|uniref:ribosome biogenesis protein BOP1 homolog isoform X1 n=1 Tax=Cucurbita pepo subsp. pepo TaxID=3664 RepID=UPI000C9D309B|nr:ribosome biogenesis protein BOP1 homolog isoform X1 [Cucurbita pepo subsp. pepo]